MTPGETKATRRLGESRVQAKRNEGWELRRNPVCVSRVFQHTAALSSGNIGVFAVQPYSLLLSEKEAGERFHTAFARSDCWDS